MSSRISYYSFAGLISGRFTLYASPFTLNALRFTLHALPFTLHASRFRRVLGRGAVGNEKGGFELRVWVGWGGICGSGAGLFVAPARLSGVASILSKVPIGRFNFACGHSILACDRSKSACSLAVAACCLFMAA
jgi:hypothetical protein